MSWDEESAARTLATLMRQAPVPPSRVDIGRAVGSGRRATRRRRVAAVALSAVSVLAIGGTTALMVADRDRPHPQPGRPHPEPGRIEWTIRQVPATVPHTTEPATCVATALPVPDGTVEIREIGGDATGRYALGTIGVESAPNQATGSTQVLWDRRVPRLLDTPGTASDVNAAGVLIGDKSTDDYAEYGWIRRDGQTRRLPPLRGYANTSALALNDRGDVVGTVHTKGSADHLPVLWPADRLDSPRVLADDPVIPVGIANGGTVLVQEQERRGAALLRPDGGRLPLPVPEPWNQVQVGGIRGDWVAGSLYDQRSPRELQGGRPAEPAAVRWNIRTGQVTIFTGLDVGSVTGNAHGWLTTVAGTPEHEGFLIAPDGRAHRLPVVHPPNGRNSIVMPFTVGDDGTVTGLVDGWSSAARTIPVTWRCR